MAGILEFFNSGIKMLAWFFVTIVLPLTTWLIILKSDVNTLKENYEQTEHKMEKIQVQIIDNKKQLDHSLVEIQRSLGRIEGEIKRIK